MLPSAFAGEGKSEVALALQASAFGIRGVVSLMLSPLMLLPPRVGDPRLGDPRLDFLDSFKRDGTESLSLEGEENMLGESIGVNWCDVQRTLSLGRVQIR